MSAYISNELANTILEERRIQAEARRMRSRRLVNHVYTQDETIRMALGPGTQFGGVTDQIIKNVVDPNGKTNRAA